MMTCYGAITNDLSQCCCTSVMQFVCEHQLHRRKYDKTKEDTREVTHLDMTGFYGGEICVPIEAESHFLNLYARDISRVNPETQEPQPQCLHLIERRTEVFRFFVDLDEKRYDAGWDRVNRIEYVKTIQRAMRRFFPEVDDDTARSLFQCVLCLPHTGALPIGNAEGEVEGYKVGMHLHFPNVYVTQHEAMLFREAAIGDLCLDFPPNEVLVDGWEGVFDACVYEANGLRMLWSCKRMPCPECKTQRRKRRTREDEIMCDACQGFGSVTEGRAYEVKYILEGLNGEVDEAETKRAIDDKSYAVSRVTIRTPPGSVVDPRFERYPGCPSYKAVIKPSTAPSRRGASGERRVHRADEDGAKKLRLGNKESLVLDDAKREALRGAFARINEIYSNIDVRDATWGHNKNKPPYLCVKVQGEGANFCENKKGDHSSNTIWFEVRPTGAVVQRCWSHKQQEGGICCRQYAAKAKYLTVDEIAIIFGSSEGGISSTDAAPAAAIAAITTTDAVGESPCGATSKQSPYKKTQKRKRTTTVKKVKKQRVKEEPVEEEEGFIDLI